VAHDLENQHPMASQYTFHRQKEISNDLFLNCTLGKMPSESLLDLTLQAAQFTIIPSIKVALKP